MRHIDEDTITQAVIARHAGVADARLREVMTSLVQHLHGFARDVKLTEAELGQAIRFLADVGQASTEQRPEAALLSDTLGLTMLVAALNQRKPRGCTEASPCQARAAAPVPADASDRGAGAPCYVSGRVLSVDGTPLAGAHIRLGPAGGEVLARSGADGRFHLRGALPQTQAVPHDGPVGRMLQVLGRHPWRAAHLCVSVHAEGHEAVQTQVFRRGDRYIDSDAVFGVRGSLIADWVVHGPGPAPDGSTSEQAYYTVDFSFVLNRAAPT